MRKVRFTLRERSSNNEASVIAEFSDDEVRHLRAFRTYVNDLLSVKLVKDGVACAVNVDYKEGLGTTVTSQLPPSEEIMAMLHRLRPLILNDEHASFNRVCGIIGARIDEPILRRALKRQRQIYDGRSMQKQIIVTATADNSEMVINSEKALFAWLNAYEYHRDEDKRKEIDRFHQLLPLDHSKAFFLMLITNKIRAIETLARLVDLILGEADTSQM
jgi:hypothetical protein